MEMMRRRIVLSWKEEGKAHSAKHFLGASAELPVPAQMREVTSRRTS
jgi:hypothetical protein